MVFLVCVKQVPGSSNVKVDEKTGLLIRPKTGNKLNPNDLYALEAALSLKKDQNDTVCAITMGPPQAEEVLNECIWMGCDGGTLISDRAFGGADVLTTSYAISQGIRKAGIPDIVFCGKQTTDGDTAQVGAEVAEHLGIPHLSNVTEIKEITQTSVTVTALQENLIVTERLCLPCLLCMDSGVNTPRLPSYRRKKSSECKIQVLTLADMEDTNASHYGLKGSPTQVQKIFPPEKKSDRTMFRGTKDELAQSFVKVLKDRKFIKEN